MERLRELHDLLFESFQSGSVSADTPNIPTSGGSESAVSNIVSTHGFSKGASVSLGTSGPVGMDKTNQLRVYNIAREGFTTTEHERYRTGVMVRCPNCCYANPAGMTYCFDCTAHFCVQDETIYTAIAAACVPAAEDLAKTAKKMAKTSIWGVRTNGVRSDSATFWIELRDIMKWRDNWTKKSLDIRIAMASKGFHPNFPGKTAPPWIPTDENDSGPDLPVIFDSIVAGLRERRAPIESLCTYSSFAPLSFLMG